MDFFERQAQAQRMTWVLLGYFLLSLILMVVTLNALAWLTFALLFSPSMPDGRIDFLAWSTREGLWISAGVIGVIGYGCFRRARTLGRGGALFAIQAGGRLVDPETPDPLQRRLLNVVEEMAIASGTPLPRVLVMPEESGINAFVAGTRQVDTALVVTQGALQHLSRDELQGVIAHEFSHIQHNDMRLNTRILMVLGGILMLTDLGRQLMRGSTGTRSGLFGGRRQGRQGQGMALVGLVVYGVGYAGLLAGRMIQAAIARQREVHADAVAVQLTRHPAGLAGALARIQQTSTQSWLTHSTLAQDLNHMCFGESLRLSRWFASHPPLEQRIRLADPHYFTRARIQRNQQISQSIGQASTEALSRASQIREALQQQFGQALAHVDDARETLLRLLSEPKALATVPPASRLVLIELLCAPLRTLSLEERKTLCQALQTSRAADHDRLSSFCYLAFVELTLLPRSRGLRVITQYGRVIPALGRLLSLFSRLGTGSGAEARSLFERLNRQWFPLDNLSFQEHMGAAALRDSLNQLDRLSPLLKPAIIDACAEAVQHDGRIDAREYDLLRTTAALLECPMPPFNDPAAGSS